MWPLDRLRKMWYNKMMPRVKVKTKMQTKGQSKSEKGKSDNVYLICPNCPRDAYNTTKPA